MKILLTSVIILSLGIIQCKVPENTEVNETKIVVQKEGPCESHCNYLYRTAKRIEDRMHEFRLAACAPTDSTCLSRMHHVHQVYLVEIESDRDICIISCDSLLGVENNVK